MNSTLSRKFFRAFFTDYHAQHAGPRCLRSIAVLCIVTVMLAAGLPSHAYAQEDLSQLSPDAERAALLINQLRANAGLSPLHVHPLLTLAANRHILDMVDSGIYGHYGSDGASVDTRVARTGYVTDGWIGENWAVYATVDTSIGWWMGDPPHRENVLNRSYSEMGVGTAPHPNGWGLILVVDFSTGNVNGSEGYVPGDGQVVAVPQTFIEQPLTSVAVSDSGVRHHVSPGDTLFSIGQRYGVDWQSIAQLNGMDGDSVLQIGADLRIPGDGENSTTAGGDAGGQNTYTVAPGDTLLGIALRLGMQWKTLAAANGLGEYSLLQIGDSLNVPGGGEATVQEPVQVARTHTIQAGETVWVIAARYDVDWRTLLQHNGLDEQALLQIGQVLTLP